MDERMPPLTDEEKRTITAQYLRLRVAIEGGYAEDDVNELAMAFQRAYFGKSRALVDACGQADDKRDWVRQVRAQLSAELAPEFWPASPIRNTGAPADRTQVGEPMASDDVAVIGVTCEHCSAVLGVQCALLRGATLLTEHELSCPVCGRLTAQSLPGAVVEVVARAAKRNP